MKRTLGELRPHMVTRLKERGHWGWSIPSGFITSVIPFDAKVAVMTRPFRPAADSRSLFRVRARTSENKPCSQFSKNLQVGRSNYTGSSTNHPGRHQNDCVSMYRRNALQPKRGSRGTFPVRLPPSFQSTSDAASNNIPAFLCSACWQHSTVTKTRSQGFKGVSRCLKDTSSHH